jgi:hypothetical protein
LFECDESCRFYGTNYCNNCKYLLIAAKGYTGLEHAKIYTVTMYLPTQNMEAQSFQLAQIAI